MSLPKWTKPIRWSCNLPSALLPADFANEAAKAVGMTLRSFPVNGKTVLHLHRIHGDSHLHGLLVDVPVLMPESQIIALCRDLDLPVSEFLELRAMQSQAV